MEKYRCEICDRHHDYYGSFPLVSMPEIIENMSDLEKEKLEKMHDSFYHMDGSFFLCKGDLYVKIKDRDWFVHWEIWAKMEESHFYSMTPDLEIVLNYPIKAKLISPIIHYDVPLNTPINLVFDFNDKNSYPEVEPIDKFSEIGQDFINGISIEKLDKWMKNIYHPNVPDV